MTVKMNNHKGVFVVAEQHNGKISDVTLELLGVSRKIVPEGEGVGCILIGSKVKELACELISYGADTVYVADLPELEVYSTQSYAAAVTHIVRSYFPSVLLLGATPVGRDLAPRISARIGTGLTADCTKLEMADGVLLMTRPAFGGNLFANIICPDSRPQMATVRQGVMQKLNKDSSRRGSVVEFTFELTASRLRLVAQEQDKSEEVKIEASKILVSIGRGMIKNDGVQAAERLAQALNTCVSCSRAVVDAGVCDHLRQVGQTGKTVRPACYIALGISGAVQHLTGMEESEYTIAVNKDKDAPIFGVANLGIIADAAKTAKELAKLIEREKLEKPSRTNGG